MKIITSVVIAVGVVVGCMLLMLVVIDKVGADVKYCCDRINETDICLDEKCIDKCHNNTLEICNATYTLYK